MCIAPKVFTVVFAMIKPFLHQATLDKIRFFGYDKDEWYKLIQRSSTICLNTFCKLKGKLHYWKISMLINCQLIMGVL